MVGRGEVEVEVPVDAVGAVGDGVGPFVGADEEAVGARTTGFSCSQAAMAGSDAVMRYWWIIETSGTSSPTMAPTWGP